MTSEPLKKVSFLFKEKKNLKKMIHIYEDNFDGKWKALVSFFHNDNTKEFVRGHLEHCYPEDNYVTNGGLG